MSLSFDMLTPAEAAARMRVSPRMLRKLNAAGDGPAVTSFGRRRLYRTDMLADWIAAHTAAGPAQAAAFDTASEAAEAAERHVDAALMGATA